MMWRLPLFWTGHVVHLCGTSVVDDPRMLYWTSVGFLPISILTSFENVLCSRNPLQLAQLFKTPLARWHVSQKLLEADPGLTIYERTSEWAYDSYLQQLLLRLSPTNCHYRPLLKDQIAALSMLIPFFINNSQPSPRLIIMFSRRPVSPRWLKYALDLLASQPSQHLFTWRCRSADRTPHSHTSDFSPQLSVCVCVCEREQEAISGFKNAELLTRSCIYRFRALATMDLATGHVYSMPLSVFVQVYVSVCVCLHWKH